MNDKFDELTKGLAQSVTRRGALKRFGIGLAAIALATLGLANKAKAGACSGCYHRCYNKCLHNGGTPQDCHIGCELGCCI